MAVLLGILVFAFVVVRGCQEDQIRINQDQAVEIARAEVDFEPRLTQVRFLRQGLDGRPNWVVSLSIPGKVEGRFRRNAVIRIDANTGKIEQVVGNPRRN